ncbi:MAG: tRNA (adenosine(37)-N6)-threonylcarbamoyltransferase complex dimerization subunit type 1 TsaB, partial [Elusimicrobia bacterium]|nr:tRNA (adenosine(37)-N6)-threonylcarbamoyltransferase complex dimerization subunit type 1 TsaB [Elusimicrobiota bacterium]
MKLLALETTGNRLGVCLWEDFRVKAIKMDEKGETHDNRLMPVMDELFKKASWTPSELDALVVD